MSRWCPSGSPRLGRWRQEAEEFKVIFRYTAESEVSLVYSRDTVSKEEKEGGKEEGREGGEEVEKKRKGEREKKFKRELEIVPENDFLCP